MLLVCKCLNITIDANAEENVDILSRISFSLKGEEESDCFFKEKLREVVINQVTVQVKSLVRSKIVGPWFIEHCLNCSTDCYATHSDGSLVLANASLVSQPDVVEKMRSYKDYSPVFRILIEPSVVENNPKFKLPEKRQSPQKVQVVLTSLQQQVNEAVREQVTKTEEKIRLYTEQQYNLLEKFRERATRDHKALTHRVYEAQPRLESEKVPANGDLLLEPIRNSSSKKLLNRKKDDSFAQNSSQMFHHPANPFSKNSVSATNSLDSEGLFVLEGMEDSVTNEPGHSEGESDTDHDDSGSHDEGIDIHRKRLPSFQLAKSLPVNVPVYSIPSTTDFVNDEESRGTVDIAASIKALARSVHGDAIFGDLPRPRFSTQI